MINLAYQKYHIIYFIILFYFNKFFKISQLIKLIGLYTSYWIYFSLGLLVTFSKVNINKGLSEFI